MKSGFIGLGIMGSRMATNICKAGFPLVIYNRTKLKAVPLLELGAEWAETPSRMAEQVIILFTMLSTPQAVEECALGSNGFLDYLPKDALWVDHSTVNPSFSQRMQTEANKRGIRFIDAPVAGSRIPAEKGELVVFAGGEEQDVKECQPYFDVIGRKTIHVGGTGKGAAMKMVNNSLLGQAMLAFSEAVALGEALGLPQKEILDFLSNSTVVPPLIAAKRMKIEKDDYSTDFPLQWMQKDLQLASESAYEHQLALPSLNVSKEIYQLAARNGLAEADFSAIYRFLSSPNKDD